MLTYEIILNSKRVPVKIKLSNNKSFKNIQDFHSWLIEQEDSYLYGEDLKVVYLMLRSAGLVKIKSEALTLKVGKVLLISLEKWNLNIKADQESVDKIKNLQEKFRIHGFLPVTPAIATVINFSSKTRKNKADKITLEEILISTTKFQDLNDILIEPAYRGGLLANPASIGELYENVSSYDINSAYPAAIMVYSFPMGPSTKERNTKNVIIEGGFIKGKENLGYIGKFKATGIRRKSWVKLPSLQAPKSKKQPSAIYDRLGLLKGKITFGASLPEMALFQMQYDYDNLEILELHTHKLAKLPKNVRKYAGELYKEKIESEGDDKLAAKLAMNSLIGCWGRDPLLDSPYNIDSKEKAIKSLEMYNGIKKQPTSLKVRRTWDYRWAVYLNSYVRYFIGKTEKILSEKGVEVLYADTDSIKCIGSKEIIESVFKERNNAFKAAVNEYDMQIYQFIFDTLGQFKDESIEYNKSIFFTRRGYIKQADGKRINAVISGARKAEATEQLRLLTIEEIAEKKEVKLHTSIWRKVELEEPVFGVTITAQLSYGLFTLGNSKD